MGVFNAQVNALWLKALPGPVYKLLAQNYIDYTFPRHLFIETTAACNLACSYCPRERRGNHMDYALFQALVDEITQHGPRSVSLHLFGEPLLYPRCCDAIRYLKDRAHTVLLTTNGTQLNRLVDEVIGANPDLVLWSWRPEAKFTDATKAKLRKWGKFRVRFIAEVTPKEAYDEWKDWPNVEGRNLHSYGGNIDLGRFSSPFSSAASPATPLWACYHLFLAPAIGWNGNHLLCCADPHQSEVLGTFPQMSVAEAWRSEKLQAIRAAHMKKQFSGICKNCTIPQQYPDLFYKWQYQDKQ